MLFLFENFPSLSFVGASECGADAPKLIECRKLFLSGSLLVVFKRNEPRRVTVGRLAGHTVSADAPNGWLPPLLPRFEPFFDFCWLSERSESDAATAAGVRCPTPWIVAPRCNEPVLDPPLDSERRLDDGVLLSLTVSSLSKKEPWRGGSV